MKKIKLFAMTVAALMATSSFAGGVVDLNSVKAENNWYTVENVGAVTNKSGAAFSNGDSGCEILGKKTGSSYFTVQVFNATKELTFTAQSTSNRSLSSVATGDAVACGTALTKNVDFTVSGGSGDNVVVKNVCGNQFTLTFAEPIPANNYVKITLSGNAEIVDVTFVDGADAAYPFVKSFTMGEVEAVVDTAAKTIVAELPYGTDRAAAIENAEVVMGGTAKTFSIAGDVLTAIDSVDVAKNIDYDLSGIVVAQNPSTDATLSMITINGVDMAGFDPAVLSYSMVATEIPEVDAVVNDPTAEYYVNPALEFPGTTEIFVTAQDGVTKLTYSINFTSADKVCGMIARATATGENKAVYSGALAGTADAKLKNAVTKYGETGYKLNSTGNYLGINLTEGAFRAGDMVNVFITSVNNADKKFQFFSSSNSADVLFTSDVIAVDSMNHIILPAEADGATSLYIVRTDANGLNPNIAYIEVVRDCEPKLLAFSLAGVDAEIDQEAKTVTAELPFGTVLEDSDWDNAYTLNGAATRAEYNFTHTSLDVYGEDGNYIKYTLDITIAQSASDNANLSEITVNGTAIAGFRADSLEYAFELPNGTVDLPVIAAVAEDITAEVVIDEITALDQLVNIVVTAQDGVTVLTYTVQLSVASAPKFLYEAVFSNGAKGAIDNDAATIIVPYLDGEAYPTLVSDSVTPGALVEQTGEDKILVTGSDESTKEFSITFQALSAPSFTADTVTFDGSESYIYAFYGWDADKGVKFAKAVNEAANMRITTGKTRVYMALPACYKVNLISGSGGARDIKVSVNGGDPVAMKTAAKNAGMDILLSTSEVNFVAIESAQTGGDGGFIKMVMTLDNPTKLAEAAIKAKAERFMFKGAVYFRHNAKVFNMMGQEIRF